MRDDGEDRTVCCFTALVPLALERVRARRLATLSVTAPQCDVPRPSRARAESGRVFNIQG